MPDGSTKIVLTALAGNSLVTVAKFFGFFVSGSSALLAEAVHSLAETANQGLLYLGLRRSMRKADSEHHFGYGQERYFWNLYNILHILSATIFEKITMNQLLEYHDSKIEILDDTNPLILLD